MFNTIWAVVVEYLDYKGEINFNGLPLKDIALGILIVKWIHTFAGQIVVKHVANNDLSYTGDLIASTTIQNEIAYLNSSFLGKIFNALINQPFLYQTYHRYQLYEYLPSMILIPIHAFLSIFNIDLDHDIYQFGKAFTGFLGAFEPFNDIYLLLIIFFTQRSSFFGDMKFFKLVCGYIPLALTGVSWFATQAASTWANVFAGYPVSQLIMEGITFIYMIWPTFLVAAYNFL